MGPTAIFGMSLTVLGASAETWWNPIDPDSTVATRPGCLLADAAQQVQEGVAGAGLCAFEIACQHADLVDEQRQDAPVGAPDGPVQQVVQRRGGAAVAFQAHGSGGERQPDLGQFLVAQAGSRRASSEISAETNSA